MAVITPPSPFRLRSATWKLLQPTQVNVSGWSGRRQVVRLPGAARWSVSGEFVPIIQQVNAQAWQAFFVALDGQANSVAVRAVEAQQTALNNPTISGAGQTGNTLNLAGLTGSVGSVFLPTGSKLTIPFADGSAQMVMLTAPLLVATGLIGAAAIHPRLRQSPANGAAVEVQFPYALMALTSDETGWSVERGQVYGFAFDGQEAF